MISIDLRAYAALATRGQFHAPIIVLLRRGGRSTEILGAIVVMPHPEGLRMARPIRTDTGEVITDPTSFIP